MIELDRSSPVSVCISTRNERANIAQCIETVLWADEIFVVDSGSTDGTREIAAKYPVTLIDFHYQGGYPKKFNWCLENVPFRNEWVLLVDADERIPPELKNEIIKAVASKTLDGYFINLQYIFLGAWLRHTWNPVWRLKLFKHRLGRYEQIPGGAAEGTGELEAHEPLVLKGRVGYLKHHFVHHDYKPYSFWIEKHNRYSSWEAETAKTMLREPLIRNPVSYLVAARPERRRMLKRLLLRMPARPLLVFLWLYVVRRGFLDGYRGLVFSLSMAYYWLSIGIKMREDEMMPGDQGSGS